MIAYEPKYEPLLIKWWADLAEDREKAFHSSIHGLGDFLLHFRQTSALMFEADNVGIWFAAASTPYCDGALWDVWIRKDKRHLPSARKAMELAYTLALERYPSLFGMTIQPELHATHLKLGYNYAGILKGNFNGKDQYVYQLTREGWANRRQQAAQVRAAKRERREDRVRKAIVLTEEAA